MAKEKGSAKTGGRKAGTPNKVNKATKEVIAEYIGDSAENFKSAMQEVYDNDKPLFCALYIKLLPYVSPRLNSVDVTGTTKTKLSIEEQLRQMSED